MTRTLRGSVLACTVALVATGGASAELVARGIHQGMLALGPKGTPSAAYVRGTSVMVSTRGTKGRWRAERVATVSAGSRVMAFAVGSSGPVALVQSADTRRLVVVRRRQGGWQSIRLANGLPPQVELGWPGLTLDRRGEPVVAYTRWSSSTLDSQLLLARIDERGRVRAQRITAEGFPQSIVAPPAAPVLVGGRAHVIESYGYRNVVGTIEWSPDKGTWTGQFIDAGIGDFPVGPVLVHVRPPATVYAAWTASMLGFGMVPVTLAVHGRSTNAEFVLQRALTTALAVPASGPEVAANEWVAADELELEGEDVLWAGTVSRRRSRVELDGWIAGFAADPRGGRDLLLSRPLGLSWFRSPRALTRTMTIAANASPDGSVAITGRVPGATRGAGRVLLYRERPGAAREAVGRKALAGGSFSFVDRPPVRPVVYRAVYTDPATGIPYAALLRRPIS